MFPDRPMSIVVELLMHESNHLSTRYGSVQNTLCLCFLNESNRLSNRYGSIPNAVFGHFLSTDLIVSQLDVDLLKKNAVKLFVHESNYQPT